MVKAGHFSVTLHVPPLEHAWARVQGEPRF